MKRLIFTTLTAASMWFSAAAHALVIDFTDLSLWGETGASAPTTVNYGGLDVTLSAYAAAYSPPADFFASPVPYTNTPYDGQTPCSDFGGIGLACEGDGIGIGDDELTFIQYEDTEQDFELIYGELLHVSFSEAVDISSITLLDLFGYSGSDPAPEKAGIVSLGFSGGYVGVWEGTAENDGTGFLTATLDNAEESLGSNGFSGVTDLFFGSGDILELNPYGFSDFSLAAITLNVPEPSTLALLGVGLLSLISARRRTRS